MADHRFDQLLIGVVHGVDALEDRDAAAEHRDPVRDLADLVELVSDDDDAEALGPHPPHHLEEGVHLLRSQHAGGLVKDHQARPGHQHLQDLRALPLPDGQVLHSHTRLDGEAELRARRSDTSRQRPGTQDRSAFDRQRQILRHGQRGNEAQVLEHHPDPQCSGLGGGGAHHLATAHRHPARIGGVHAVDHLEQGALPRAVLADDRVHLTGPHLEVDSGGGGDLAESLGDTLHPQQWRGSGGGGGGGRVRAGCRARHRRSRCRRRRIILVIARVTRSSTTASDAPM